MRHRVIVLLMALAALAACDWSADVDSFVPEDEAQAVAHSILSRLLGTVLFKPGTVASG